LANHNDYWLRWFAISSSHIYAASCFLIGQS
jgi:hypothetical protein